VEEREKRKEREREKKERKEKREKKREDERGKEKRGKEEGGGIVGEVEREICQCCLIKWGEEEKNKRERKKKEREEEKRGEGYFVSMTVERERCKEILLACCLKWVCMEW
jgi:hypothetical protein